jgi:hypothetical protein
MKIEGFGEGDPISPIICTRSFSLHNCKAKIIRSEFLAFPSWRPAFWGERTFLSPSIAQKGYIPLPRICSSYGQTRNYKKLSE